MKLPSEIEKYIDGKIVTEAKDFHVSGDEVYNIDNEYILKVSNNIERLQKEYEKDKWFHHVLPTPKPLVFIVEDETAFYLRECICGEVLCLQKYLERPHTLIKLLKEAINIFHNTSVSDCPFQVGEGDTLIHGDFCLPNILVKDDKIVGFIDLGEAGIGDIWYDYAWCIWSFEFNLQTKKYTKDLLKELNIEFNEEKFIKYTAD